MGSEEGAYLSLPAACVLLLDNQLPQHPKITVVQGCLSETAVGGVYLWSMSSSMEEHRVACLSENRQSTPHFGCFLLAHHPLLMLLFLAH